MGPDPINPHTHPMFAVAWNDKKLKQIISNCGTTTPCATDSIRTRHRRIEVEGVFRTEQFQISIKRPDAVEMFYRHFSTIDVHDHYRQGNLEIERTWVTRIWWKRLFGTLLGVIVTNSFLMYKYEFKKHNFNTTSDMMNFFEFVDVLVLQLIKNNELENTRRLRHLEPLGRAEEDVSADGKLHISETHS
jgi:hypothetical protein